MRGDLHRAAAGLAWLLCASCHPSSVGFRWGTAMLDAGPVSLGGSTAVETSWFVDGSDGVELLALLPSCGCTGVELRDRGAPQGPGPLRAGAAGTARIQLRGTGSPGRAETAIDVLWRTKRGRDQRSVLKVAFDRVAVFAVTPAELTATEIGPQLRVPFRVSWRSLRPGVLVHAPAVRPHPSVEVTALHQGRSERGEPTLVVEGHILPPSGDRTFQVANIELTGVEPEPPGVPVRIGYRAAVERTPVGMLMLDRRDDGRLQGHVSLRLSQALRSTRIRELTISPADLQGRFAAEWSEAEPRVLAVTVVGTLAVDERSVSGTLSIRGEDPLFGDVVVRWMYLAPRRTS